MSDNSSLSLSISPAMSRKVTLIGIAAAVLAAALFHFIPDAKTPAHAFIDPADPALVARGSEIYASRCASCHGAKLEGQPEWRTRLPNGRLPAPPHDRSGHTWHHPDTVLVDIVKNGLVPGKTAPDGYQSDMPAYGKLLSDDDIAAVLAYIKSTWPPEILQVQKDINAQRSPQ